MLADLDQSVETIATLPVVVLSALSRELKETEALTKKRKEALNAALERIFGQDITKAYQTKGEDGGVVRVPASNSTTLKVERDREYDWDQPKLLAILKAMSAEDATHYMKAKYEVPAKKFDGAPPDIQARLRTARIVKIGRSRFTFEDVDLSN